MINQANVLQTFLPIQDYNYLIVGSVFATLLPFASPGQAGPVPGWVTISGCPLHPRRLYEALPGPSMTPLTVARILGWHTSDLNSEPSVACDGGSRQRQTHVTYLKKIPRPRTSCSAVVYVAEQPSPTEPNHVSGHYGAPLVMTSIFFKCTRVGGIRILISQLWRFKGWKLGDAPLGLACYRQAASDVGHLHRLGSGFACGARRLTERVVVSASVYTHQFILPYPRGGRADVSAGRRKKVLGKEHTYTLTSKNDLAVYLRATKW